MASLGKLKRLLDPLVHGTKPPPPPPPTPREKEAPLPSNLSENVRYRCPVIGGTIEPGTVGGSLVALVRERTESRGTHMSEGVYRVPTLPTVGGLVPTHTRDLAAALAAFSCMHNLDTRMRAYAVRGDHPAPGGYAGAGAFHVVVVPNSCVAVVPALVRSAAVVFVNARSLLDVLSEQIDADTERTAASKHGRALSATYAVWVDRSGVVQAHGGATREASRTVGLSVSGPDARTTIVPLLAILTGTAAAANKAATGRRD